MKKYFSALFLLIFLFSCSWAENASKDEETPKVQYVQMQTVEKKKLSEIISFPGKVSPLQEVMISPLSSGMIQKVYVQVGDRVKMWDVLAQIDTQSSGLNINVNNAQNTYNNTLNIYAASKEALQKNLSIAQLQYDNAVISKNNTYTSTQKQLELAQNQLDSVKKQASNTQNTTTTSLDLAKESVANAELSLSNFDKNAKANLESLSWKKSSLLENMKVSLDGGFATLENSLIYVDTILWVTEKNRNLNDGYEIYLGAKDSGSKTLAENTFLKANRDFYTLKNSYNSNLSQKELQDFYKKFVEENTIVVQLFDQFNNVLENTIVSAAFNEQALSGVKTQSKTLQGQVITLKSNLVNLANSLSDLDQSISLTQTTNQTQRDALDQTLKIAQLNFENAKNQATSSLDSMDSSKTSTQIQLENTIATIQAQRDNADNAIKIAQNQLSSANANYNSQLSSLQSQIDGVAGQKDALSQQLDNTSIRAPFDGIITQRNIEIGSMVSGGSQVFGIAMDMTKVIKSDVSAQNISYFQVGEPVTIVKNKKSFSGSVSVVSESANPSTKMYGVEVILPNTQEASELILWDYVDISFEKNIGNDLKVIIPFSALIVGSDKTYSVFVVGEDQKAYKKAVEIGESNSKEVEITNWLTPGEKIVIGWGLSLSDGAMVADIQK